MGEGERFQLGTVGALTLSVVSSVSIVICNKALMSSLHFIFGEFAELSSSCNVRHNCLFICSLFWLLLPSFTTVFTLFHYVVLNDSLSNLMSID